MAGNGPALWRRVLGEANGIGWWILPAFVAVGLAGAVMAGALAVVYYSQQVAGLEAETRESRQDLQRAVDDVERAAEDALSAIGDEVDAVRGILDRTLPVSEPAALGIVIVEARIGAPPPAPPPPPGGTDPAPAPDVRAQADDPSPTPTPTPSPTPPPARPRIGVGFAVAVEGANVFVATSYDLVRDPNARAGVAESVVVTTVDDQRGTGVVHSWDEDRGIALLRVGLARQPLGDWRPRGEELDPGERVAVVGLTPERGWVQMEGVVGHADQRALVTSLPDIEFLRGAPIVDRTGRIVGVYTPDYRPYGGAAGDRQAMAPVGMFCERMLQGCEHLEVEAPDDGTEDDE